MMINLEEAKKIAIKKITKGGTILKENPPVIIEDSIIEYKWGWLFYYEGQLYFESKSLENSYVGNVPVLVDKKDGTALYIGLSLNGLENKINDYFIKKGYLEEE